MTAPSELSPLRLADGARRIGIMRALSMRPSRGAEESSVAFPQLNRVVLTGQPTVGRAGFPGKLMSLQLIQAYFNEIGVASRFV